MLTGVFAKALRDRMTPTLVIAGILLFYEAFGMGIYSSFDNQSFEFIEDMPEAVQALYGTNDGSNAGIILGATFNIMAPLLLLIYAISGATNAATGEERGKTLGLLLANPLGRTRLLMAKTAVVAVGAVLICAALWGGLEGIGALVGIDVSNQDVLAACVQLAGLSLMFGALAIAIGAATGRAIGSGITAGIAAVSYLLTSLLPVEPDLEHLASYTPWYLYSGGDPLNRGVDWQGFIAMLAIAAVLVGAGTWLFNHRDLRD